MRIDEPQAERRDREHRLTFGIAPRANARACQKGGYLTLYRSDGAGFSSEQDCTSYAVQGNILATAPPTPPPVMPTP
jgi:hypothetical protein